MDLIPFIHQLVASPALAAGADTVCQFVGGDCGPEQNVVAMQAAIASFLVAVIAALSVLFVVWGGAQMIIAGGDESKVNQGRMSILYALVGFAVALGSQVLVSFAVARAGAGAGSSEPVLATIGVAVDAMLGLFNTVFLGMTLYAGFRLVWGRGKGEETDKVKSMLMYAIFGGIAINVASNLVQSVLNLGI
ncbi:MAG: hypothetical protein PHO92_01180 [Candidatus Peribacteraceae bacterium]|nr:hypothetical protein [Candidatus Peribacteraceae bacterium]